MYTITQPLPANLSTRQLGVWGEDRAADFLEAADYRIFERNWRCREGELDIIAYAPERRALVGVEVKTRRIGGQVAAYEAVSARKLARLRRLLIMWINESGRHAENLAIDLIAISADEAGKSLLEHKECVL